MHRSGPLALFVAACLSGCASTKNAPIVPTENQSGFLEDYTNLRAGREGEPAYVYRMPNAIAGYDKVIIEPVEVWRGEESVGGRHAILARAPWLRRYAGSRVFELVRSG